jgi:hypothetical protein
MKYQIWAESGKVQKNRSAAMIVRNNLITNDLSEGASECAGCGAGGVLRCGTASCRGSKGSSGSRCPRRWHTRFGPRLPQASERASDASGRGGRARAGAAMTARATHLCERRRHGGGGAESSPHFEAESASRHVAVLPL